MLGSQTAYPHIATKENVPYVEGTTMKVVELVLAHQAHGWSPYELHYQFPHLSMSQIHAALAYYWDNKTDLDADIERRATLVKQFREEAGESPVVARLKSEGHLPDD